VTAKNLVVITIDALRHDAMSCAGSRYASTPNLDALAGDGVLFEQAIANGPRTQSSFPSIMTSSYPLAIGERRSLPPQAATLAEAASDAGLATAGFNPSNPFLTRETGYDRGFDLFVDFWDVHQRKEPGQSDGRIARTKKWTHDAIGRRSLGFLMLTQALLLEEGGQYQTGRYIADRALAWLDKRDGPFFLWLHFMDVHFPYQPLPGRRTWRDRVSYVNGMIGMAVGRPGRAVRALTKLYGQRVELVDSLVGDIVGGLSHRGLADSTVVAVTSDHGEQLGDHGRWAHGPDLHDELIRVPLVLRIPGLAASHRIGHQVELLDLAPTLLELLGIQPPPAFTGSSFASLALTGTGSGPEYVFSEAMHSGGRNSRSGVADTMTVTSCRGDGWKYIHDTEDGCEELYDLSHDPDEHINLAGERPETTEKFRRVVNDHRRFVVREAAKYDLDESRESTADDEEMRKRLAALGYL
jgi:arylsulfatase A-like enzyme